MSKPRIFNQTQRQKILRMVEDVMADESFSVTRSIAGFKVTAKSIPNSQRCQLSIIDTDKSKFKN